MKLTVGKRILMFFHWLMSLLICAVFATYLIKPELVLDYYHRFTAKLNQTQILVIGIALLAIYVILAVVQICLIFHRGKRNTRGFITVDSSDTGRVRISVAAIEQMVRQAVLNIDGISDMKIAIESLDDAIGINIAATLINGSHVPTVTMNMQQAIRKFVEMNCGVAVRTVSININGVTNAPDNTRRRGRKAHAEVPPVPAVPEPETPVYPEPVQPAPEPYNPPKYVEEDVTVEPAPAPVEPEVVEPVEDEEPAYDIPEPRPIKLTLDYNPVTEGEAPETTEEE